MIRQTIKFLTALLMFLMSSTGAWATDYFVAEFSGSTLTFKKTTTAPDNTTSWDVTNTGNNLPGWYSEGGNITQVVFDPSFADARPQSCYCWFGDFRNLTTILGIENLNTSEVTNMTSMFHGCGSLTSLDLSHFDTNQVTDMGYMFYRCSSLQTLNLSSFNTSQVTYMSDMFEDCSSLQTLNLSSFNTSQVTTMSSMFNGCSSLTSLDLSSFNTSQVTDMRSMFDGCSNLTSLAIGSGFTVGGGTITNYMFYACNNLATGTLRVRGAAPDIKKNIFSGVYTSGTLISDVDLPSDWMGGNFSTKTRMTAYAVLTDNTDGAGTKTLTFKYEEHPSALNNTTEWDVTNTEGASGDEAPGWFTSNNYENITQVVFDPSFADARPKSCFKWFYCCTYLTTITGIEYLNTREVTDMSLMFDECSSLTKLDVSHFNTSQVTDMNSMFSYCGSLTSLDVSHFYTSQVTDMSGMFWGCCDLTSLDVSSFNTSQVTNMGSMFMNCSSLTSLSIGSGFEVKSNTTITNMFEYCYNLANGTLVVKGTLAPSIADGKDIFSVFTDGILVTTLSQTDLGYTGPDADGKYTWKGGKFNKSMKLANNLGTNVTVTFYDGGAAEPIGFDVTAPGTPVISADAGQWIVMHIVPAEGYWTDAQLLMAMEKAATPARAKAPGIDLGQTPKLLKRDTYTDAASTVLDRQDGAGWYYYQIPAAHTCAAGYTTSTIEGYVVKKFDLGNSPVSLSDKTITVTGIGADYTTPNGWTAEFTYDQLSYKFDALPHSPTLQSVVVKKNGTKVMELTNLADISKQVQVPSAKTAIFSQHSLNLGAASLYTWFKGSVSSTDACFEITIPFKGSGTIADPWQIETAEDLNLLSKCTNVGGYSFSNEYLKQMADIDMNGITDFQPIAMGIGEGLGFGGSYNGDGKTIKNLTYQQKSSEANGYAGLFGYVENGTVQNVSLENCQFSASYKTSAMGGIAGYLKQGTISGCTVKGNSSVKGLYDGCATGAIVGQKGADGTLSKNYYTYDVSVSNSSGTATGYTKRGYWNSKVTAWDDVNDATEGAMLLVKKATLPAASANGSTVTFNEVTPGTDCYAIDGANYYYAPGQTVTINVTLNQRTETTDIRTFYDELSTLTMNDGTTDTDIKEKLAFKMPETDATIAATITESDWFTIPSNKKNWMSLYHTWTMKDDTGADVPGKYEVTEYLGSQTIEMKTVTGIDAKDGTVTVENINGCYSGMPTLFHCEGNLPEKLKFTPNTTATNSVTPNSSFKGTAKALTAAELDALGNGLYVMNGLGEFIRAYDHTGGLAAHRCYINLGSETAPSRLKIKDETLGISPVVTGSDFSDENWYSLDGRKLEGKPTKKGLYINGGRKVVIK